MGVVWRKKHASVIRTKASKPTELLNWRRFLKPAIMLCGLLFTLILYSNWSEWLERLDKTPIKSFALTHKTRFTTDADIRDILSQEPALKGYFGQDIQAIKQRFLTIPWVRDVVVRKVFPNRLSITLIEHQPVAHWNGERYISEQGVPFTLPKERFNGEGLPILSGPDIEGKTLLDAWSKIKQDLQLRNLNLSSVTMDSRGAWTITLDNGVRLILGRGDWLPKIDRFVAVFPNIEMPEGERLSYVDLRYEHGVSVGFVKNKL